MTGEESTSCSFLCQANGSEVDTFSCKTILFQTEREPGRNPVSLRSVCWSIWCWAVKEYVAFHVVVEESNDVEKFGWEGSWRDHPFWSDRKPLWGLWRQRRVTVLEKTSFKRCHHIVTISLLYALWKECDLSFTQFWIPFTPMMCCGKFGPVVLKKKSRMCKVYHKCLLLFEKTMF